mgnify:FL=1
MKKISQIIIKILIIIFLVQPIFVTTCQAEGFWGEIMDTGKNFINDAKNEEDKNPAMDQKYVQENISKMYNIFLMLGIVLAVLIGAVLGIKFITGSIEEQAKIKEALIVYLVGCIIIFGAFGIWRFMVNTLKTLS